MDTQENSPTPIRMRPPRRRWGVGAAASALTSMVMGAGRSTRRRWIVGAAVGVASVAVLGAAFLGVAGATDQPAFCGSACHEMGPYHAAWAEGAHKNVACVDCHVDAGTTARLEHKVSALNQLVEHVKGAPKFPLASPPAVPDSRCVRCHPKVNVKQVGFSHDQHAKRGPCVLCHSTVGHSVSSVALKSAGVLRVSYAKGAETTSVAKVDGGSANLAGHITVPCSRCHDMAATPCSACHKPTGATHPAKTDCATCHATGAAFVFTHPTTTDCGSCHKPTSAKHPAKTDCTTCHLDAPGTTWAFTHPTTTDCGSCHKPTSAKHPAKTDCTTCHKSPGKSWAFTHPNSNDCASCHNRPANHRSGDCATCHQNRGVSWSFAHPGTGANCAGCHARPANHKSGSCATCHQNPGRSWAFTHPGRGANCASCHARPANHKTGSCATCHHNPGKSWAFTHPSAGASCASCHNRPSPHNAGACQNCHRNAGKSWAFSHSSGLNCRSCHQPPASHYGTTCQSCHSPSKPWANAVFHHPSIPGGEHTYKSFACVNCHPSGPPAHYCTCHKSSTGPSGG